MLRFFCLLWCILRLATVPLTAQSISLACKRSLLAVERASTFSQVERNLDLLRHDCHFYVDPQSASIRGTVTTWFHATLTLDAVEFDAGDALQIDSVRYHGLQLSASRPLPDLVRIHLPGTLAAGTYDSITVFYHGTPRSSGFGSFEASTHDGQPVLWTLSEPYGARDWWPCRQTLDDKIDSIDIRITNPAAYRSASNGIIVEDTVVAGERTTHWRHRYPIATYLVALAVTNYARFDLSVPLPAGTVPVINLCFPEDSGYAVAGAGVVVRQMQLFDSLFGTYPFFLEQYGQAQFGWGGGMEHQTMTFLGNWEEELIAHELAHHWFGDMITCGSWQDIWLNEGFATYLSGLCYEFQNPPRWKPFREKLVQDGTRLAEGSVWCDDTSTTGRIFSGPLSYSKGAMVLHMLRRLVGDSAFFAGVRAYAHDPAHTYSFARTSDLLFALESACLCDLNPFFEEWFEGSGYPRYTAYWEHLDNDRVALELFQESSAGDGRFFRHPIELGLFGNGRDTFVLVAPVQPGERFEFDPGFRVHEVLIDPRVHSFTNGSRVYRKAGRAEDELVLYPNPADGSASIRCDRPSLFNHTLQCRVYDPAGRLVRRETAYFTPTSEHRLETGTLSSGSYLVELTDEQTLHWVRALHVLHP